MLVIKEYIVHLKGSYLQKDIYEDLQRALEVVIICSQVIFSRDEINSNRNTWTTIT